jgi:phospholipid transport system transporter-binding protein
MHTDSALRIDQSAPGVISIAGDLNFTTAAQVFERARARLASDDRVQALDLGGVRAADSAGLACVLALMAGAHRQGKGPLAIRNVPESLRLLARVSDVESLLDGQSKRSGPVT